MASPYQQPQQPLPGAYYGGATAPPPHPYPYPQSQAHRRRSCFCCLFSTFLKLLAAFFVLLVILVIVLWLVLRPNPIKVYVNAASLHTFNLTSSDTLLRHNLTADFSIRNPNKRVGVYYDWLEADGYYGGEWLNWVRLPRFYQGHKNTTAVRAVLAGDTGVDPRGWVVDHFKSQKDGAKFDLELRLYGWIRYKVGSITTRSYRLRVKCWLPALRLKGAGGSGTNDGFVVTKCKVNY